MAALATTSEKIGRLLEAAEQGQDERARMDRKLDAIDERLEAERLLQQELRSLLAAMAKEAANYAIRLDRLEQQQAIVGRLANDIQTQQSLYRLIGWWSLRSVCIGALIFFFGGSVTIRIVDTIAKIFK